MTAEKLNLIGINVGGVHLHRGGEVNDHRALGVRLPDIGHRLADLQHKLRLGKAEGLWRIFKGPVGFRLCLAFGADLPCTSGGQRHDFRFTLLKHPLAKQRRGGVIEMHDGARHILQRHKRTGNQVLPRLGQHL